MSGSRGLTGIYSIGYAKNARSTTGGSRGLREAASTHVKAMASRRTPFVRKLMLHVFLQINPIEFLMIKVSEYYSVYFVLLRYRAYSFLYYFINSMYYSTLKTYECNETHNFYYILLYNCLIVKLFKKILLEWQVLNTFYFILSYLFLYIFHCFRLHLKYTVILCIYIYAYFLMFTCLVIFYKNLYKYLYCLSDFPIH